jgi:hypothetical protein
VRTLPSQASQSGPNITHDRPAKVAKQVSSPCWSFPPSSLFLTPRHHSHHIHAHVRALFSVRSIPLVRLLTLLYSQDRSITCFPCLFFFTYTQCTFAHTAQHTHTQRESTTGAQSQRTQRIFSRILLHAKEISPKWHAEIPLLLLFFHTVCMRFSKFCQTRYATICHWLCWLWPLSLPWDYYYANKHAISECYALYLVYFALYPYTIMHYTLVCVVLCHTNAKLYRELWPACITYMCTDHRVAGHDHRSHITGHGHSHGHCMYIGATNSLTDTGHGHGHGHGHIHRHSQGHCMYIGATNSLSKYDVYIFYFLKYMLLITLLTSANFPVHCQSLKWQRKLLKYEHSIFVQLTRCPRDANMPYAALPADLMLTHKMIYHIQTAPTDWVRSRHALPSRPQRTRGRTGKNISLPLPAITLFLRTGLGVLLFGGSNWGCNVSHWCADTRPLLGIEARHVCKAARQPF